MSNAINWFEIPVDDFDRACRFYSEILSRELHTENMMGAQMGFLSFGPDSVGGAIIKFEGFVPSDKGTLVYLNGGEDLTSVLNKVEVAGGKVIQPKTKISDEIGFMARFKDTEGNVVALHSPK